MRTKNKKKNRNICKSGSLPKKDAYIKLGVKESMVAEEAWVIKNMATHLYQYHGKDDLKKSQ